MHMKRNWTFVGRLALVLPLLALAALGFVPPAQAADFRTGDVVIIDADEVIDDDLFVSGERVEVNGTVKGDLFATGGQVVVNGQVEGSLIIAAQAAEFNGQVDGSVYGSAYSLVVGPEASAGRNLYVGAYSLETEAGSTVGRSLYVGAYQAVLGGEVARDVRAGLGALELNGQVNGDLYVEVGSADTAPPESTRYFFPGAPIVPAVLPGLHFGPEASVAGNVWYQSRAEQALPAEAVGGQVTFATPAPSDQPGMRPGAVRVRDGQGALADLFQGFSVRAGEFIALLIVGGLLLRFWPEAVQRVSAQAQARPLPSTGWGCLVTAAFFVGVPLAAIAIFVVAVLGGLVTFGQLFSAILGLGGAALGLTVSAGLFVLALVTKVIIAYLVGRLILSRLAPQSLTGRWGDLGALALGAAIYEVLRAIPFGLGWVIGAIVTLIGVGAIYFVVRQALRPAAPEAPAATTVPAAL
jgi:hypothetical protein